MASPEFTTEMLADLGDHLFSEGLAAYEEKDFKKSLIWFSQCLDVCRNFENTEMTVGRILFFIGAIYSYLKNPEQMMGFCEAFVTIFQKQPPELRDGSRLLVTGAVCFHNGNPALAGRAFKLALRYFQELDLPRDVNVAQEQLQKLGKVPLYRIQSREFLVRLDQQPAFEFTVTTDGKVQWGEVYRLSQRVPVGSRFLWNTICVNT